MIKNPDLVVKLFNEAVRLTTDNFDVFVDFIPHFSCVSIRIYSTGFGKSGDYKSFRFYSDSKKASEQVDEIISGMHDVYKKKNDDAEKEKKKLEEKEKQTLKKLLEKYGDQK